AIAAFEAFQHPLLRLLQGEFAEGTQPVLLNEFQEAIENEKEIAPRERVRVLRQRQIAFVITLWIKLMQIDTDPACRLEMINDRQRNEHEARSVAQFVEIHVEPAAHENDLWLNRWHVMPALDAQQRAIALVKLVASLSTDTSRF